MKFFLDSANLDEISEAADLGFIVSGRKPLTKIIIKRAIFYRTVHGSINQTRRLR